MPLALRTDAGSYVDFAVGANRDPGSLVGTHAGCLDKAYDADPNVAALSAQAGLLFLDELIIADHIPGFFKNGQVIATVEDEL